MKLRNKETGEIRPAEAREDGIYLYDKITEQWYKYGLSLLAEYWEYYEEPKEYWFLSGRGEVKCIEDENTDFDKDHKSIGNYFETKEKAEKAVEKLNAWKRLKDKGFRFRDWDTSHHNLGIAEFFLPDIANDVDDYRKDLDLLFGGEE